jgi:hypothetical protein
MAFFPTNNNFFEGLTPFGSVIPQGVLTTDQEENLRKQALVGGLLGAGATYLSQPKNQGYGSALPYLAKSYVGGMGTSQGTVDATLNNLYRQQLLSLRDDKDKLYNVDGALVDRTGKVVYQSSKEPKEQKLNTEVIDVGGKKILINKDTGAPIQSFAVTKPPAEPQTPAEIVKKSLTPLETELDKKAADDLVQFTIGGGFSDVQKGLSQLTIAKQTLKQQPEGKITGKLVGAQDDTGILKYTNPTAQDTKEQVQEIAQRNLRLILGPQFTAKEGEALINRVYNPALPQSVNVKRLDLLQEQMTSAAKTKQEAVDYYNTNGTLKGFKGKLYNTTSDFLNEYNTKLKTNEKAPTKATTQQPSGFTEGSKTKSKSGKPMIFRNGQWEYE